jgi:formylglycine-generating enzyme required for sulfatase activity/serine/threonine protein kinase
MGFKTTKVTSRFGSGVRPATRPSMPVPRAQDAGANAEAASAELATDGNGDRPSDSALPTVVAHRPDPVPPRAPPVTIGRYALYDEIASGGMATVHFGRLLGEAGFSRPVAIKRLHAHLTNDPELRAMFMEEARLVARIRHQNVVPTLDVVASEDELFLVMEYVQGESLWRLMKAAHDRRVRIPPSIAMAVAAHVLHGLHAAHEARSETGVPLEIVHRDVSPQNVLVGTDGAARVLDFGVARASIGVESARQGKVKGKLSYMAPEQLGGGDVTRKADIYAASVILWELLSGKRLFYKGDPQTVLIEKLFKGVPQCLTEIWSDIPDALDEIVLRGLSRDPALRFESARTMAIALESCGPLASLSEVSAWVEGLAHDALEERAQRVSEYESCTLAVAKDLSAASSTTPPVSLPTRPPSPPDSLHDTTSEAWLPRQRDLSLASLLEPELDEPLVRRRQRRLASVDRRVLAVGAGGALVGVALTVGVAIGTFRAVGAWLSAPETAAIGAAGSGVTLGASPRAQGLVSGAAVIAAWPGGLVAHPGGDVVMGSDDDLPTERPSHNVSLSPYCIDVHEVTTADYKACSDHGECKRAGVTNEWANITNTERKAFDPLCNVKDPVGRARHPINCVDWDMARGYCQARGTRLPTEAEWEYAARSSDGRKYPWGDDAPTAKHLNACGKECLEWARKNHVEQEAMFTADDGWATTAPVGSFPAGRSPFGALDMVGNVWEWVADYYGPYAATAQEDPKGPGAGRERGIRGGAWNGAYAAWVRPTFRYKDVPEKRSYGIGFRCAASAHVSASSGRIDAPE